MCPAHSVAISSLGYVLDVPCMSCAVWGGGAALARVVSPALGPAAPSPADTPDAARDSPALTPDSLDTSLSRAPHARVTCDTHIHTNTHLCLSDPDFGHG